MVRFGLIPMKELSRAKARLSPVLDDADRRELALALFRDVLAAALACPALDSVAVTSRDGDALSVAGEAGAEALPEPGGLNEALTLASEAMARRGARRIVVLAADLPLAGSAAIEAVARSEADVAVVPSRDGGTNALALPPRGIDYHFGPDSAQRHLEAARAAGLTSRRLNLPSLALDIDAPEDLTRLCGAVEEKRAVGENTRAALVRLGLIAESVAER